MSILPNAVVSNKTVILAALLSLAAAPAFADAALLPATGRATLSFTLSDHGIVGGDAMQPLYGTQDAFLYGNLMGDFSTDESFLVSPGAGVRFIGGNQLFGARLFADFSRTSPGKHFTTLSPGFEWMSARWDVNLNAYMPTQEVTANGSAYLGGASFQPGTHNQFNEVFAPYTVTGKGMDAEVGYSFAGYDDRRSRIFGGGYYYDARMGAHDIRGVTAGLEMPFSERFSAAFLNSYDNVNKYTAGIKLSLSIGADTTRLSDDVHGRSAAPVRRRIGIIDNGAGLNAQNVVQDEGPSLQYTNVFFFAPGGTGDGTYGNPASLTQATLDSINGASPDNARLYLQGGQTYTIASTFLTPYNGQNFYGRNSDYTQAAQGNERPNLYQPVAASGRAIFSLGDHGASTNEFHDLRFSGNYATGNNTMGIRSVSSNKTTVVVAGSDFSNFDDDAFYFTSPGSRLFVSNSTLRNNNFGINFQSPGGTLDVRDSVVSLDAGFNTGGAIPSGITVLNTSAQKTTFTANNLRILFNGNPNAGTGLTLQNQSSGQLVADIDNLMISNAGIVGTNALEIRNIGNGDGSVGFGGQIDATLRNSLIENGGQNANTGNIYLQTNNSGTLNFNFINSTSRNGNTYGLLVVNGDLNANLGDTTNVNIKNSLFDRSGDNIGPPYPFGNIGIWSLGQGAINFAARNTTISNTTGGAPALWVSNGANGGSISNSAINVQSLSGTSFTDNTGGGIYVYGLAGVNTTTTIDYTGAVFTNSTPNTANDPASTGTITWVP